MRSLTLLLVILATWHFASGAEAALVTPGGAYDVEGDSSSKQPFNFKQIGAESQRFQQVFTSDSLGNLSGIIDTFGLRSDRDSAGGFQIGADIEVWLSHTSKTPNTLSPIFSENLGADATMVFDDLVGLSFPNIRPVPNPFAHIDVDDIFLFNGVDNFLIDIRIFNKPSPQDRSRFDAVNAGFGSYVFSGAGDSVGNPSGTLKTNFAVVMQFDISPVPLPASIWLFLTGITGLVGVGAVGKWRIKNST